MKKIIINYIEYALTVLIYSIPVSIIVEIICKQFEINLDIPVIIAAAGALIFLAFFKPFLSKKKSCI